MRGEASTFSSSLSREDGVGVHEWIFGRGQPLDESRSSFEELGKLVDTQLPR
jgi:hypothetical protein